jgi:hypothetical protein
MACDPKGGQEDPLLGVLSTRGLVQTGDTILITAAHACQAFGTRVKVTFPATGRVVVLDRRPLPEPVRSPGRTLGLTVGRPRAGVPSRP